MGAILSALAEWLGPFLIALAGWFGSSLGRLVLGGLGLGLVTFTGLDSAANVLFGYFSGLGGFTGDVGAFFQLLGGPEVLAIWGSAVAIKVAMVKGRAAVVAASAV
jgi:hypothetical protein